MWSVGSIFATMLLVADWHDSDQKGSVFYEANNIFKVLGTPDANNAPMYQRMRKFAENDVSKAGFGP
jgi:hypothetical protein